MSNVKNKKEKDVKKKNFKEKLGMKLDKVLLIKLLFLTPDIHTNTQLYIHIYIGYGRDRRDYYDRYDRDKYDRYDRDRIKGRDRDGSDKHLNNKNDNNDDTSKMDDKELQAIRVAI